MYNFEHEVESVINRYLRYFFWYDYFHDGVIHSINRINDDDIELIIQSDRESKDLYSCIFKTCMYFNKEIYNNGFIYLNGRFKDSATVLKINNTSRNKFLHLRIQTTGGYVDIIFSKFEIINKQNEINIPKKLSKSSFFDEIKNKYHNIDRETIIDLAVNGNEFALSYLGYINDPFAVELSKKALNN